MATNHSAQVHSVDQSSHHRDSITRDAFSDLEWPEDATLVSPVDGYLAIELPAPEPVPTPLPTASRTEPRLLHGRSPLGRAAPILADDLEHSVAKPARLLQLICDGRGMTHVERPVPPTTSWKTLKSEAPIISNDRSLPSCAQGRARDTEPPLARSLVRDFELKYYRKRLLALVVQSGLARHARKMGVVSV